jgi:hypothetical protein
MNMNAFPDPRRKILSPFDISLSTSYVCLGAMGEVESGKWKVGSGKWKVESGKWKLESGKWKVESGKWKVETPPPPPVFFATHPVSWYSLF